MAYALMFLFSETQGQVVTPLSIHGENLMTIWDYAFATSFPFASRFNDSTYINIRT